MLIKQRLAPLVALAAASALWTAVLVAQATPAATRDTTRRAAPVRTASDSAITPPADQARGVDAELRSALFELVSDRPLAALSGLQWLRSQEQASGTAAGATMSHATLLFLLTQTYYRLGMGDPFRATASELAASTVAPRFASIARAQLMLDAYRRGDYKRAIDLAGTAADAGDKALAGLIAGLARYQTGNYPGSRESFAAVKQAGGPYAPYAQYMDALAAIGGDTLKSPDALSALQALTGAVSGELADQVRVSAAQLAYQGGQYDVAASLTEGIAPASGFAAEGLLTRAWALYKAKRFDAAASAFTDFATRFPLLPQRDEARLLAAQIALQAGRTDEAAGRFQSVADSVSAEANRVAGVGGTITGAARALVSARAAGVLFIAAPQTGKTLALPDEAGSDPAVLIGAFSDAPPAGPMAQTAAPTLVSLADIDKRLQSVGGSLAGDFPRRVLYVPASGSTNFAGYVSRSDALSNADVSVALARFRLKEQMNQRAARLAVLQALQQLVTKAGEGLTASAAQLTAAQDSLAKLSTSIEATVARVRAFVQQNADATRQIANENLAMQDSMTRSQAGSMDTTERAVLQLEQSTASTYRQLADLISGGLNAALAHHPAMVLRDSVTRRLATLRSLLAETQGFVNTNTQLLSAELARLQQVENQRIAQLQSAVTAAESQRAAAESQMVALVEAELRSRSGQMVALLRHDAEAAEYGSASATFFKAVESGRPAANVAPGTPERSGGTAGGTGGAVTPPPPRIGTPTSPR
ncbi:MAG: hypothetical protein ACR2OG_03080 [Gemmatimonadaceae bacterium]